MNSEEKTRRKFGQHFTSRQTFEEFILPHIRDRLFDYIWVDMYAGSGNLILPMLNHVPESKKIQFFKNHVYMFDVQKSWVTKCRRNATELGIPKNIAQKNIQVRNSLENPPDFLYELDKPIFHVTNPPYLYLGYIAKHEETQAYLRYFEDENDGYQDLYQIAMINDLRSGIKNLAYIIPSNFLYGNSVSRKFRKDFLKHYSVEHAYIFEKKIFENTGTNVIVGFFHKKERPSHAIQEFQGEKYSSTKEIRHLQPKKRKYRLIPKYKYRAGAEFEEFVERRKIKNPLKYHYYLKEKDIKENAGNERLTLIDANNYDGTQYVRITRKVSKKFAEIVRKNLLWVRTVDTGSWEGRAGLYRIDQHFDVDGILVTKNTYRTNPIQLFIEPPISPEIQLVLKDYVNVILQHLREVTDSEFMTTYKYSNHDYIRKYFGLRQLRKIIRTFPHNVLDDGLLEEFKEIVKKKDSEKILSFIDNLDDWDIKGLYVRSSFEIGDWARSSPTSKADVKGLPSIFDES